MCDEICDGLGGQMKPTLAKSKQLVEPNGWFRASPCFYCGMIKFTKTIHKQNLTFPNTTWANHLSFHLFQVWMTPVATYFVWANVLLQGIIVPSGCCVHIFMLMPPGCRIGNWHTGTLSSSSIYPMNTEHMH